MLIAAISVERNATVREALAKLDATGKGIVLLIADNGEFVRTVTDGDLRRLLLAGVSLDGTLENLPESDSVTISPGYTRRDALGLMQQRGINHLPVVDDTNRAIDLVERSRIDEQVLLSTPHMGDSELEFVAQAFKTNWIAPLGPNVDAFERELAEKVGTSHAVALSSGTAAIHLALVMLGVGPGDTVFCSTLTFAATANPIVYQGAEPIFIDSEPESWNMSPEALERALAAAHKVGRLPKAVLVVNLYGQSANMDPIIALCERYGVPMIEDAAESLGAQYKGKPSGTFGLMGIYSFNGNKIITTSGGGMLVTEHEELASRARFYATQARDPAPHYQHSTIGYNYRMSNILAGVGRGQLRVLDQRVEARRRVFSTYRMLLADLEWLRWMPEPNWSFSNHWLSVATLDADSPVTAIELIGRLSAEFIEARPVWKPMHLQPVFADRQYFAHDSVSISDSLFEHGICLPSGSNMTDESIERVVSAIKNVA